MAIFVCERQQDVERRGRQREEGVDLVFVGHLPTIATPATLSMAIDGGRGRLVCWPERLVGFGPTFNELCFAVPLYEAVRSRDSVAAPFPLQSTPMDRTFMLIGAVAAFIGVGFGAFGA